MDGPLAGIHVLEFTQLIMGPQCCQLLRDLGCEIIKIENPKSPDNSRHIPASESNPAVPVFHANNRGKRSLALDFSKPEGMAIVRKLIQEADVLVGTLSPGALDRAGLGYEVCRELNSRLIYALGTTYGPEGPESQKPGNDMMAQAFGGLAWNTGTPDTATGAGALVADTMGGMTLFGAIVSALFSRERSGEGQMVETSLLGGQIWAQSSELMAHTLSGSDHPKIDRTYPWLSSISPISVYRTSDGYIALSGFGRAPWDQFWRAFGFDEIADNIPNRTERITRNAEFSEVIAEKFMSKTTSELGEILDSVSAIWAPVNDYDAVVTSEQVLSSGYLRETSHPIYGQITSMGAPVRYSEGLPDPADRAPELGEHSEEVLLELGYDWDQIELLKDQSVI